MRPLRILLIKNEGYRAECPGHRGGRGHQVVGSPSMQSRPLPVRGAPARSGAGGPEPAGWADRFADRHRLAQETGILCCSPRPTRCWPHWVSQASLGLLAKPYTTARLVNALRWLAAHPTASWPTAPAGLWLTRLAETDVPLRSSCRWEQRAQSLLVLATDGGVALADAPSSPP